MCWALLRVWQRSLAPLYEDIRDTFAAHNYGTGSHIQLAHGQA